MYRIHRPPSAMPPDTLFPYTTLLRSAEDVPIGPDESANIELARWGEPRRFDFKPQDHAYCGPALGLDFEAAAAMSGARFTALRGQMADRKSTRLNSSH